MVISVSKLAPRAIVLAAVGYCIWPSVSELTSDSRPKPPQKVPELAAALFSPTLPPSSTRDPFAAKNAARPALAKESADKTAGKTAVSAAAKTADPLSTFKLDATCIVGDRRLAVINGQLYASQDKISAGNSSLPAYKIVSVLPYKVLLEGEGKTVELKYSDVAPRPAASPEVGGPAKPGGAAKASWVKKLQAAVTGERPGGSNQPSKAGE